MNPVFFVENLKVGDLIAYTSKSNETTNLLILDLNQACIPKQLLNSKVAVRCQHTNFGLCWLSAYESSGSLFLDCDSEDDEERSFIATSINFRIISRLEESLA